VRKRLSGVEPINYLEPSAEESIGVYFGLAPAPVVSEEGEKAGTLLPPMVAPIEAECVLARVIAPRRWEGWL
jgi:hypothetical protein